MRETVIYLTMLQNTKTYQFKAKDSEIKMYSFCLGNISRNFPTNNVKK